MRYFIIFSCILLISALSQTDVKIKKNYEEIERFKQHLKTGQITCEGKIFLDKGTKTYIVWNATKKQIDVYINGNLAGHINEATGFVND